MSKISQKLYVALTRSGVSSGAARHIAESVEFLGDSTVQSAERDDYEITIAAKALSSLVKRHLDTTPIIPSLQLDEQSSDMTRVGSPLKAKPAEKGKKAEAGRSSAIILAARRSSPGTRRALSYILPCLSVLAMILVGALYIAATLASLAAMLGTAVCGTLLFLAGLLYGVSQISVFFGGAMFELGIALISGGLAVCMSVLLFNLLTRALPFCRKRVLILLSRLFSESASLRGNPAAKRNARSREIGG